MYIYMYIYVYVFVYILHKRARFLHGIVIRQIVKTTLKLKQTFISPSRLWIY